MCRAIQQVSQRNNQQNGEPGKKTVVSKGGKSLNFLSFLRPEKFAKIDKLPLHTRENYSVVRP